MFKPILVVIGFIGLIYFLIFLASLLPLWLFLIFGGGMLLLFHSEPINGE